jgi:hypothetical protein
MVNSENTFGGILWMRLSAVAQIQYAAEINASARTESAARVSSTDAIRSRSRTPINNISLLFTARR